MQVDSLMLWLASGERGISSNTIVQHLTGLPTLGGWIEDHPHDPADLRRCFLLLEAVPRLVLEFQKMKTCSPTWAALVKHWEELRALMDEECPNWRDGHGSAPKTYERMRAIIKYAETKRA